MILQIASIRANPGKMASGFCAVNVGVATVQVPVILLNGARPGSRLTIFGGVHGTEYVGMEAVRELIQKIDPQQLRGQVIACPIANPPSFYEHRIACSPLDGINPNRVFPGNANGRPTERLVAWLFEHLIKTADFFIDLHGGEMKEGLLPFVGYRLSGDKVQDRRTVACAEAYGLPHIIGSPAADGGNSHAAATRAGVVSLLIEIGELGSRQPELISQAKDGLLRVMSHLDMIEAMAPNLESKPKRWQWSGFVTAPIEGLWYPQFEINDQVQEGALLGRILDPLGQELTAVYSPETGKSFYGLRSLAVASGDDLVAIAVQAPE